MDRAKQDSNEQVGARKLCEKHAAEAKSVETDLNTAAKNAAGAKAYAVCRAADKAGEAAQNAKETKENK